MEHGFIKVAAVTPKIKVADPVYNAAQVIALMEQSAKKGAKVIVFPELCLTGYTCGDLFLQQLLLETAAEQLLVIQKHTEGIDALVFVGLPIQKDGRCYNVAAVLSRGKILGMIPKKNMPSYGEFYEGRHFTAGSDEAVPYEFAGEAIPFGRNLLFSCAEMQELVVGCEICEDLWVANPPGTNHALKGATLLVNLSASNETVGKGEYRELLVKATSARLLCGYVYCSAGEGESTQDLVFAGHNLIAENGSILSQSNRFGCETVYGEIDLKRLLHERQRMGTFGEEPTAAYEKILFHLKRETVQLERTFGCTPFVPSDLTLRSKRCEEILSIQAYGLKQRYEHTHLSTAVIGLSGGLDSTLALLVTVKTFDLIGLDRKGILAVTMPCFGTTGRTKKNAVSMAEALGVTLKEVDIKEAVRVHFRDIGQNPKQMDVTYENSQARERTQILMDIANQQNALVIGTGDMSELALGWATYNGDHMSMYGVNVGVPKTLVRHLVQYYADTCAEERLAAALKDVIDTPVSPELLPPVDGVISQKTEDLVGPYELHDFFLYYMLRFGYSPEKIYRIALLAFKGQYEEEIILKWLTIFTRRFFTQQFKRSCLPDGPKVGSVAVSPRGDLRMPSDACAGIWMAELERLA